MTKYPMKLVPCPRQMIWGGNALKNKYNKFPDTEKIGESWELTCRPEASSVIANGIYKDTELRNVLSCGYDFPLLIKFIDACDDLSVQVHPDDDIKDDHGKPLGKTEMWYIIDAKPDSYIVYGLCDNVSLDDFRNNVEKGDFVSGLKKIYVKPGECYFIPAGQVHAICKGILLAEIQQNSDTTYRFYDYERLDKNGNPRELHVDNALNVMKAYTDSDIDSLRFSNGHSENCLADCSKFKCFRFSTIDKSCVHLDAGQTFNALIFTEGEGSIVHNTIPYPCKAGDTYFIPEGIDVDVIGDLTFLCASPKQ